MLRYTLNCIYLKKKILKNVGKKRPRAQNYSSTTKKGEKNGRHEKNLRSRIFMCTQHFSGSKGKGRARQPQIHGYINIFIYGPGTALQFTALHISYSFRTISLHTSAFRNYIPLRRQRLLPLNLCRRGIFKFFFTVA